MLSKIFDKLINKEKQIKKDIIQSFDLIEMIIKNPITNIVFSEFSAQQILLFGKYGTSNPILIELYNKLLNNKNVNNDSNSVWIIKDIKLQKEYEDMIYKICDTYVIKNADQELLNNWINDKKQNIMSTINFNTNIIAINTMYFKSEWETRFALKNTKKKVFYTNNKKIINKNFMMITELSRLYESEVHQILCKNFGDGYYIAIVMNINGYDIPFISKEQLLDYINYCDLEYVEIELPNFSIECEIDLKATILESTKIDIENGYDKISDELIELNNIKQKIFINIDENGINIEKITKIWKHVGNIAKQIPKKQFKANRPFSFHIIQLATNTILFSGVIIH
jgi:serine protease inhibitor